MSFFLDVSNAIYRRLKFCSGIYWAVQYHEGVRTYSLVGKAGYDHKHPYDIGYFSNLSAVIENLVSMIYI
jgi:hypothetical protein